jgi:hypothetical protein
LLRDITVGLLSVEGKASLRREPCPFLRWRTIDRGRITRIRELRRKRRRKNR